MRHVIASLLVLGLVGACDSGGPDKKGETAIQAVGPDGKPVMINAGGVQSGDVKLGADGSVTTPGATVRPGVVEAHGAKVELGADGVAKVKVGGVEVNGADGVVKVGSTVVDRNTGTVKAAGVEVNADGTIRVPGLEVSADGIVKTTGGTVGAKTDTASGGAKQTCPSGNCQQRCSAGGDFSCDGGNCNQSGEGGSCKFSCSGGNCEQACKSGATCKASCDGGNCRQGGAFAAKSCMGDNCTG